MFIDVGLFLRIQNIYKDLMDKKPDESPQPAKTLPKWLQVLWVLLLGGIAFLIAGHIFAEKPVTVSADNRLYGFFTGKEHEKLVQQLDKNSKVVLVGNRKDGLYLFVDYYTSRKIKEGFLVKKRVFEAGEDLKYEKFPLLAKVYHLAHMQVVNQEPLPTLWLIETRSILNTSDLAQIAAFAETHPNHRFIVAANETTHGKDASTFKKLAFTRPSEAEFSNLLKNQNLTNVIAKNIIRYHNKSFEFLSHLVNVENIANVWSNYFSDETENINGLIANYSKAEKILSALCENGEYPSKEINAISPYNGAISHEGKAYYWTSLKHIYAYSNKIGKNCETDVKFVAAPEKPEVIVQEVTVEVPKAVEPVPAKAQQPQQKPKAEKKTKKADKKKKGN